MTTGAAPTPADSAVFTTSFRGDPQFVWLELTSKCNLRCTMCAINEPWYTHEDLHDDAFERLRPAFPHIGKVGLSGHGESLVRKKQFLAYLKEVKAGGGTVEATTNLTLADDETVRTMVEQKMNILNFSIHAATPELYRKIMRKGEFRDASVNMENLNRYKRAVGSPLPSVDIQFVGMKSNIHELPALVRLAKEWGIRRVVVLVVAEYSLVRGESLLNHPRLIKKWFPKAMRTAITHGVGLTFTPVYLDVLKRGRAYFAFVRLLNALWRAFFRAEGMTKETERFFDAWTSLPPPKGAEGNGRQIKNCLDPWRFSFVIRNGMVRPCCAMERNMGNVNETDFMNIWHGAAYARLREEFVSDNPPEECQRCVLRNATDYDTWRASFDALNCS